MSRDKYSDNSVLLKDAVIQCTKSEPLRAEKLEKLSIMQEQSNQESSTSVDESIWRRWRPNFVVVTVLIAVMTWYTYSGNHSDYMHSIAREVIENHLNLKPLETSAQSIAQAQSFFVQLDFVPSQSNYVNNQWQLNDQQLIGGRYCSIQGGSAAQLRYKEGERLYTLYQVAYDEQAFGNIPKIELGEQPQEIVINGLRATIWLEKGLLMALVTEA